MSEQKNGSGSVTECPEIDLLRQVVPLLHEKVCSFQNIVSQEYISPKSERNAQQAARREMDRLEEARLLAENAVSMKGDMQLIEQLQDELNDIAEQTRTDVVNFQRAMIAYDTRQDEYNQSNKITRQFLSPRTRFVQAWAAEAELSPRSHQIAHVNFLAIAFAIPIILSLFYVFSKFALQLADILEKVSIHDIFVNSTGYIKKGVERVWESRKVEL